MSKAHAVRLDDETTEWLEGYAKQRGEKPSVVLRSAVVAFRRDCEGGVPDLKPAKRELPPGVVTGRDIANRPSPRETIAMQRQSRLNRAKYGS